MCEACRYFDPADGYCVIWGDYHRKTDTCPEWEKPRKQMMVMDQEIREET